MPAVSTGPDAAPPPQPRGFEIRWPTIAVFGALAFGIGALLIPFSQRSREKARRKESEQRLHEIWVYSALYHLKFGGARPDADIVKKPGKIDESAFRYCAVCTGEFLYLEPPTGRSRPAQEDLPVPIAWCDRCMQETGRAPVLFQNGKIEEISRDVLKTLVAAAAGRGGGDESFDGPE